MWFISVKIAPHYHNIINPEQGQPHLTLLGRITTAVSHFILNRVYIQGTFYFLGPYWFLLVCNVF